MHEVHRNMWIFAIFSIIITSTDAILKCKHYGSAQNSVKCTPGDSDYNLKRGIVSDNNRTTKISLRGCRISNIDYESFEEVPSLKYLDLSQNKIQELKLGVLDGTLKVTHLNLSYNFLTGFPLGIFDQKPNLMTLDLTRNSLKALELGIFDPLSKLQSLNLSSNNLIGKDLSPYLFDQSPNIINIDFSRNDMSEAPDNLLHAFQALSVLNIERCFLKEVPKFAITPNLKTMKQLTLSTNQITRIDDSTVFVNLDNLERLNLAENNLEYINENVLKPLRKLKSIYLRSNKLTSIPENLFQNIPKLINIELSHNHVTSLSVISFKGTSLKNLNISDNKLTFLPESFCSMLKLLGVPLTKLYFNPNPWQCACLRELVSELKAMNIEYNVAKFDGKRPICYATNNEYCKRL